MQSIRQFMSQCFCQERLRSLFFEQLQDSRRLKQHLAKKFAANFTPRRALLHMADAEIPQEQRPDLTLLKNNRPTQATSKSRVVPVHSLADLQKFIAAPPETLTIFEDLVVCNEERVQIPFACRCLADILGSYDLTCFVCDFTYKVCQEGLLLGAIGPVGLTITDGGPRMRMVPAFFIIASSEDYPSHKCLFELWFRHLDGLGISATDGFFDCLAMHHAEKYARQCGRKFYIHRCLQHVKSNVKEESAKRDQVTGKVRLQNQELISPIVDWIEFAAGLPCDLEFDTFWQNILQRMASQELATDFGEPRMASYLRKHILDASGPLLRATWCSGLGAVPEGYSCYAANTIESGHKSLKHLLSGVPRHRNVGQLLIQVDEAVKSKADDSGFYNGLQQSVTGPPSALEQWPRKRGQRIQPDDGEDSSKTVSCFLSC